MNNKSESQQIGLIQGSNLQESLPLCPSELDQHVDELEEARALLGVAKLWLCVLEDLLTREHWVLIST